MKQIDKKDNIDEDSALASLLMQGYVSVQEGEMPGTVQLVVSCNDTFGYACADAEPLEFADIWSLFAAYQADTLWGVVRWCCRKRQMRPLREIEHSMRLSGAWDEVLERLPTRH